MGDKSSKSLAIESSILETSQLATKPALVTVESVNGGTIKRLIESGDLYEAFEASLPFGLMDYREFEGRMKKLAYDTGSISLK